MDDDFIFDGGRLPGEQVDYKKFCAQLLGALGHELNNTLAAILGNAELNKQLRNGDSGFDAIIESARLMRTQIRAFQMLVEEAGENSLEAPLRSYPCMEPIADIAPYLKLLNGSG